MIRRRLRWPADTAVRVVGKHCETDILIDAVAMQQPEPGDLLAVPSTGAYTASMASKFAGTSSTIRMAALPRAASPVIARDQRRIAVAKWEV